MGKRIKCLSVGNKTIKFNKKAIDDLDTDQIILLSDGIPSNLMPWCDSRGKYYSIDECLTEYNNSKRKDTPGGSARIDTIFRYQYMGLFKHAIIPTKHITGWVN